MKGQVRSGNDQTYGVKPVADAIGFSDHSVFAKSMIQVLKANAKSIPAVEVFQEVRNKVVPITSDAGFDQTPQYGIVLRSGHESGDFIFKKVSL